MSIFYWGKIFNKGLSENEKEEGLFKRLKNIENAQKGLIKDDDKDKNQQTNNIDTKPPNVFKCLKSLSQEINDLMDKMEEVNNDIDIHKFLLLVVIKKILILLLLVCHYIFFQIFIMVKFH